jgi:hypothetical protein
MSDSNPECATKRAFRRPLEFMGSLGLAILCAPSQFSERTPGETAQLGCRGVEFLGMIAATRLERGEPAAEAREFIRRQFCDGFGDFFDFHMTEHNTFLVRAGLRQMAAMIAARVLGLLRQWA